MIEHYHKTPGQQIMGLVGDELYFHIYVFGFCLASSLHKNRSFIRKLTNLVRFLEHYPFSKEQPIFQSMFACLHVCI